MMSFQCPHCDRSYHGPEHFDGKRVRCKSCGEPFTVEGLDEVELIAEPVRPKREPRMVRPRVQVNTPPPSLLPQLGIATLASLGLIAIAGISFYFSWSENRDEVQIPESSPPQSIAVVEPPELIDPSQPYDLSRFAVPTLPDLPPGRQIDGESVTVSEFQLQGEDRPGQQMTLRVYLPTGNHAAGSLPCVLVGPAGTPLITGNSIDGSDYHDESLPYARAGAVVITFSLDGAFNEDANPVEFRNAYLKFRDAAAGLVNCRNALEFAVQKIPAVDASRIVIAGHSSAATLALLFAEHEPRLAGCLAYCPAADSETRCTEMMNEVGLRSLFPGIDEFIRQSAPLTHVSLTSCPVYLFHTRQDENCPVEDTEKYFHELKRLGKECDLHLVHFGDHYSSMIEEGIPGGINWLKKKGLFTGPKPSIPNQPEAPSSPFIDL